MFTSVTPLREHTPGRQWSKVSGAAQPELQGTQRPVPTKVVSDAQCIECPKRHMQRQTASCAVAHEPPNNIRRQPRQRLQLWPAVADSWHQIIIISDCSWPAVGGAAAETHWQTLTAARLPLQKHCRNKSTVPGSRRVRCRQQGRQAGRQTGSNKQLPQCSNGWEE